MTVLQDEILDTFIAGLQERALTEFRNGKKETQERYERVRQLSEKFTSVLSGLEEEEGRAIEEYMDEKDSLTCDELEYVYLQGVKDSCKLLKILEII